MKSVEAILKFAIKVLFGMMIFHNILLPASQSNPRWPEGVRFCHMVDGDQSTDDADRSLAQYNAGELLTVETQIS